MFDASGSTACSSGYVGAGGGEDSSKVNAVEPEVEPSTQCRFLCMHWV